VRELQTTVREMGKKSFATDSDMTRSVHVYGKGPRRQRKVAGRSPHKGSGQTLRGRKGPAEGADKF